MCGNSEYVRVCRCGTAGWLSVTCDDVTPHCSSSGGFRIDGMVRTRDQKVRTRPKKKKKEN